LGIMGFRPTRTVGEKKKKPDTSGMGQNKKYGKSLDTVDESKMKVR